MHVAVDKRAPPGQQLASYIDHLEQGGYTTPPRNDGSTVDLIRQGAPMGQEGPPSAV